MKSNLLESSKEGEVSEKMVRKWKTSSLSVLSHNERRKLRELGDRNNWVNEYCRKIEGQVHSQSKEMDAVQRSESQRCVCVCVTKI